MKKIILTLSFLMALFRTGFSQNVSKPIPDGLYVMLTVDSVNTPFDSLKANQTIVAFSKLFEEYNDPDEYTRIIIDISEYVPLDLEKPPVTEKQTDLKKKLMLSLTKEASEQLKTFTAKHVMRMVTLVVDGEALTIHRIKTPLTSGKLQITRCNDNACEKLYVKLKDNVK